MKTKIITSENDKIGVVLYGCKGMNNSLKFNHIYVLQKLDCPDASTIKSLENKIPEFTKEYGFAIKEGQSPLFEALWICH
jgi:Ku70/Ku80 N-terminal alpha/beta domain